ncbi:MAG: helix-turn-helix domain-containing protein [Bacteroidetes bacterium]|jgi:excisionase family DNA binding protein|nr:helix-turn-helix domain-containing protein [Bacteroidota bacterium]MBT5531082.1 helix-turn-helix domain-containing protein [Cytophagia bacterium]
MKEKGIRIIEQLISIPNVAKRLDISIRTAKRLIRNLGIETYTVGKRIRIREVDLMNIAQSTMSIDDMINVKF